MMVVMTCWACGIENRGDARFCRECGSALATRQCASCGTDNSAVARFCDECGEELAGRSGPRSQRRLEERVSARAAERRLVTVMFADAKGSTALTERFGDEEMYRLVQGCVSRMQHVVDAHEGTVVQFRGDGIMALFGAPVAVEDAAVGAVTAGLEIQEALREYGSEVANRNGPTCPFRVGLNTGHVVVGQVGDDTLVDYTAIGDTANVAARMEQAAGAGEVLLSESTWRAVHDYVDCERVGSLAVKGKQDEIVAYRALRRRSVRDRFDAATARGLTRFVGRDDELSLLHGFAARLIDGHGQVVAVSGEAGIGKSRLLRELAERLPEGVDFIEGRSSSADRRAPWHLVVDLLRRTLAVEETDTRTEVGAVVDERSRRWSVDAHRTTPYLKWLLGVPTPELDDLDPQERRAGIFEALVTVLRNAATRRPIVVALEDLHWADEASEAAIAAMAQSVADVPVLLIVTYRPERTPELGDRPWFVRLALDRLVRAAAGELAAASVGADLSDRALTLVIERSGGNPLFIEELTASLLETGVLDMRDGVVDVTGDTGSVDVPDSLQDVVLARIDRLEPEARQALQLASVIGREFTRRILDRIAQMPDRLDSHLAELESLELIRQRSWHPELAYLFKHAVVHDVTYSTLLDERRRALHRVVALATEELYPAALGDHCESLARHWLAAGEEERALPHLIEAARRAMAGFSVPRALDAFAAAADLAHRAGRPDTEVLLRCERLDALFMASDLEGVLVEGDRILHQADVIDDIGAQAYALAGQATSLFFLHDFDGALDHAARGEELGQRVVGSVSSDACILSAGAALGVHAVLGERNEADEIKARVEQYLPMATPVAKVQWQGWDDLLANWRGDWKREPPSLALSDQGLRQDRLVATWIAGLHAAGLGDFDRALDQLDRGLSIGERTGETLIRARILNTIGWIRGELGDHQGGFDWNRRSIELTTSLGLPDREIEANARLNLADDALVRCDLGAASAELVELETTICAPTSPERWMHWRFSQRWLCASGELALAGEHPNEALAFADECLALSQRTESAKYVVRATRLRGRALWTLDRHDEAVAELHSSLAIARTLGNPPQLWRTLTALAETGEAAARDHAAEAVAIIDRVIADLGDPLLSESLRRSPERADAARLPG